jgi:hypothetical protein
MLIQKWVVPKRRPCDVSNDLPVEDHLKHGRRLSSSPPCSCEGIGYFLPSPIMSIISCTAPVHVNTKIDAVHGGDSDTSHAYVVLQ